MASCIDSLAAEAERELEAALRGSSLCSVSRGPTQGMSDVKTKEGRWYALREVQRSLAQGRTPQDALRVAGDTIRQRTPTGPAWDGYREGGESALRDASACLDLEPVD